MSDDPYASIERENVEASQERWERENDEYPEDDEDAVEPSEEDVAIFGLTHEQASDYFRIKESVRRTDLSDRLVDLAVKTAMAERVSDRSKSAKQRLDEAISRG